MKTKFPWNRKMKQSAVTSNPLLWFVLLLILLTLIRAMPAFAFHKKPKKNPELLLATMQEQLKLTDHQIEQIRPILEEQEENRSKIFEKYRSNRYQDRSTMRSEMQDLQAQTEYQMADVLSEDQMQTYKDNQIKQRQRMNQRFRSRGSHRSE